MLGCGVHTPARSEPQAGARRRLPFMYSVRHILHHHDTTWQDVTRPGADLDQNQPERLDNLRSYGAQISRRNINKAKTLPKQAHSCVHAEIVPLSIAVSGIECSKSSVDTVEVLNLEVLCGRLL